MEKSKIAYLVLILLLLIVTAYLTTAFFVKFWPFHQPKPSGVVDLSPIAKNVAENKTDITKPDLSKGILGANEDPYNVSDGSAYDCGLYSLAFPKGWLVVLQDKGKLAVSSDLNNSTNSLYINQTDTLTLDLENMDKVLENIKESLGSGFTIEQIDKTDFLGKKCLTISGSADRNGVKSGLMVIVIPSDSETPGFWMIGFYDPKTPTVKDSIVASMATMLIKTAK